MMRITFLGTSGSTPTRERNLPAIAIEYNKDILLFDCGEGTQRQMMIYSVNISKIKAIFLTHIHGDHIIGIAGLVRTLALNKRTEPLYVYIPKGFEKQLIHLIDFDKALIRYKIEIKPITSGEIFRTKEYHIRAFKLIHTIDTFGLSFIQNDKIHFIKEKAHAAGLKGSMFSDITKKGSITIKGKRINLNSITRTEKGKKITYATDTKPTKKVIEESINGDLLIHEATYTEKYKELAKERGHATAMQCAKLAKSAKVNMLVLTHISARYKDASELLKESRGIFPNTQVAYDGMKLVI